MDEQTPLFADPENFLLKEAASLAVKLPKGLHFGTSTWTYPGWTGLVYKKPYPKTGASARMLGEYAQFPLFNTVGVDSFFYRPPTAKQMREYAEVLPAGFPMVMKVWDRITSHSLGGPRNRNATGEPNPDWLRADLFQREVLEPTLEHLGEHAGPFVFEFEEIKPFVGMSADEFADHLHRFFSALPRGPRYSVELRNKNFFGPAYLDALRAHNVAHVFNSWTRMPSIGEQLQQDSLTADFVVSRALLKPGRYYNEAVDAFAPYDRLQEELPDVRNDLHELIGRGMTYGKAIFIIANNRLEGSAPHTIIGLARRFILNG